MPAEPHWPHASLVMKIVQGGMEGNQKMVVAYTELLIQKLRRDGVTRQADLMQQSLDVHLGLREPVLVRSMADTPGVACTRPVCQGQPRCETCCAADAARGVAIPSSSVPPSTQKGTS